MQHNTDIKRTYEGWYIVECSCGWEKLTGGVRMIARKNGLHHEQEEGIKAREARAEMTGGNVDFQMSLWEARVAYSLTFEEALPEDRTYVWAASEVAREWMQRLDLDGWDGANMAMVIGQLLTPADLK